MEKVRFTQLPRSIGFGWLFFKYAVLYLVTLGLTTPYIICKLWNYIMDNKRFGSGIFKCNVQSKPIFKAWLISWFASIILLVIYSISIADALVANDLSVILPAYIFLIIAFAVIFAWFKAVLFSHLFSGVEFENLKFTFQIEGMEYLKFSVLNSVIIIFTLGIGSAFVTQRWVKLVCDKMSIDGYVKFVDIVYTSDNRPMFGEGLAEAFDIG